jgi:hypothetical protein
MPRRNKGFLKNTRFKARQKRNVTRRAKREATRQMKLTEKELNRVAYTFLQEAAKYPAVETYADPFDNVYELPEVEEISNRMAMYSTKPEAVKAVVQKEVKEVSRRYSSFRISGRNLFLLLLFSFFTQADAAFRWTEISVLPEDWSFYDLSSIITGLGGMVLTSKYAPSTPLWLVGQGLTTVSVRLAQAGAIQRQYNHSMGKYPMTPYISSLYNASAAEAFLPSEIASPFKYYRHIATHAPTVLKTILPEEKYETIKGRAKQLYNTYYPGGTPTS